MKNVNIKLENDLKIYKLTDNKGADKKKRGKSLCDGCFYDMMRNGFDGHFYVDF